MPYIYIYIVLSYTLVLGLSPFRLMRWKTKEEGEKKKLQCFLHHLQVRRAKLSVNFGTFLPLDATCCNYTTPSYTSNCIKRQPIRLFMTVNLWTSVSCRVESWIS